MKVITQSVNFSADKKLIDFIQEKMDKLEKYYDKIVSSEVFLKVENTSDKTALDKERNRNRFNFAQIGIDPGEELEFKKDRSIKAKVLENDLIEFRGKQMSLSQSALEIVQEMGYTWNKIAGPQFWMYKGKTLYELNQ